MVALRLVLGSITQNDRGAPVGSVSADNSDFTRMQMAKDGSLTQDFEGGFGVMYTNAGLVATDISIGGGFSFPLQSLVKVSNRVP